jgi:hypothetical protein
VSQASDAHAAGREAERPSEIPRRGWFAVLKRVKAEVKEDNVPLLAAGVAFYAMLAIFPAIIAVVTVYGMVADPAQVKSQVNELAKSLPAGADQLLGHGVPQPGRALHRPPPRRPRPHPGQQLGDGLVGHGHPQGAERLAVGVERDGGHRPLVRVDADGDHGRPFVAGMVVRDGQSDFRSTHPSVEPHRGGCRPRSAGCQRANPTGGKSTTSQSTGTLDATGCRPHVLTAIQQVRALLGISADKR